MARTFMGHVLDNSQQSNGHLHADLIRADAIECSFTNGCGTNPLSFTDQGAFPTKNNLNPQKHAPPDRTEEVSSEEERLPGGYREQDGQG